MRGPLWRAGLTLSLLPLLASCVTDASANEALTRGPQHSPIQRVRFAGDGVTCYYINVPLGVAVDCVQDRAP